MKLLISTLAAMIWLSNPSLGLCQVAQKSSVMEEAFRHKTMGDRYLLEEKTSLSIAEYQKALSLGLHSSALYFNLAIAYYSERNIEGAITALEKLIRLDPSDEEAHYNLACLRLYQQNTEQAQLHFEKTKSCCDPNSKFGLLASQGLEFLDEFKNLDSSQQDILSFLLQNGLPALSFSA